MRSPAGDAAVERALGDRDEAIRLAAVRAVGQSRRGELFAMLVPMLNWHLERQPDPASKEKEPKLVEVLVWTEPSLLVRLAAVQALGALKVADSLPALIQAMEREDSFNRLAIVRVIRSNVSSEISARCSGTATCIA